MASHRNGFGCQFANTAHAIASDRPARTNAIASPLPLVAVVAQFCTVLSQLMPDGAAWIAPEIALALLLGASSHSQAISTHSPPQARRAPRTPSRPPGRPPGQAIAPISAYRATAPGAPVSGAAMVMNSIPNASPNHHTISTQANDRTRAGLTVRR